MHEALSAGNSTPPIFTEAMRLAWLLRGDVRRGRDLDDDQAQRDFVVWWLGPGRKEYPAVWAIDATQVAVAHEAVTLLAEGHRRTVPRLIAYLWHSREDVRRQFDLADDGQFHRFVAWCHVYGMRELGLDASLTPPATVALLAEADEGSAAPVSRLLRYIWETRGDLQASFDLTTEGGRIGLADWYDRYAAAEPHFAHLVLPPHHLAPPALTAAWPIAGRDGINLIGFGRGELGIGEDLRMAVAACAAADLPFSVFDVPPGPATGSADRSIESLFRRDLPYAVNLLCMSGFDTAKLYLDHGPAMFAGRTTIGYWPWELPAWPSAWEPVFGLVDELWVSSRFTHEAYSGRTPLPVLTMPMAVSVDRLRSRPRSAFGLPEGPFLFLFAFDGNSRQTRKNPEGCVEAFRRAFAGNDASVGLVIKAMNTGADETAWQNLRELCAGDRRILLIDRTLDLPDVLGLMAVCDCLVSLHRSEGFGRTLAEAMLLGKPVIATNFSGSTEILDEQTGLPVGWHRRPLAVGDYPYGEGQWWAEPDLDEAAGAMLRISRDPDLAARLGAAGRARITERHAPAIVGRRYAERLTVLRER